MSMRSHLLAAPSVLLVLSPAALAKGPSFGRLATADEIASWDISIGPSGAGLPPGSGTPKARPSGLRRQMCRLPWREGVGKPNDQLVGGRREPEPATKLR